MIIDLHAHYPMHVIGDPDLLPRRGGEESRKRRRREWLKARFVRWLSKRFNFEGPKGTPGVTPEALRRGDVGVALSVIHCPVDELLPTWRRKPKAGWFDNAVLQMEDVEREVEPLEGIRHVKSMHDARSAIGDGDVALIHCLEGGYSLGATEEQIWRNVKTLRDMGVAYVTLAHLLFRGVATNAPAVPFLSDGMYRFLFPQPRDVGLTSLGRAAVRAMVQHGVLIDLTHMSDIARCHTFEVLNAVDPGATVPVMATHAAYRFNRRRYALPAGAIRMIASRDGVVGVIACAHHMCGAKEPCPAAFSETVDVFCRHVDRIREITGSYDHIAIGSDIDGYIKPALESLGTARGLGLLEQALIGRYGEENAEKICSANAERVLDYWDSARSQPAAAA